jgi:glycosyltransferase involved in cell wall biosynthesis
MRVLHLNTLSLGGSYEYAALLSTALAEQGIESRVLCKNSRSAQSGRLLLDHIIRRLYVSFSTEPWHGTRRLLSPPAPKEMERVDVVHLHTVADWFDVPSWLETLPASIGVVVSLHDMWHVTGGCFLYRGCNRFSDTCTPCPILKMPLNRVLARDEQMRKLLAYRSRGARFVANSHWLAGLAERSPIVMACGGVRTITPGIDTDVFTPQDKIQCRRELGLPIGAFVIAAGAASLTDKNKNFAWLLEQLGQLSEIENLLVVLAGQGAVDIPIGLNARVMGNVSDRSKRAMLFSAADVFVTASLMETYGLTLIEAMSCGTPVVAFRLGGIPEAAPDGEGAILCPPQDGAALIGAILKLQNSKQLREALGNAGHEMARNRNGLRSFAEAFMHLYEECLHPVKPPSAGQSALVA